MKKNEKNKMEKYTEERSWGSFERFSLNGKTTIKILQVNPNEGLSLHYHQARDIFLRVMDGTGKIVIGIVTKTGKKGDEFFIPREINHQIKTEDSFVTVLEISSGDFDEDDIVRLNKKKLIPIEKHGIILSPTENEFENSGVMNPGIYQDGNNVHIFYRAVKDGNYSTIGYAKTDGPIKIDVRHEQPIITRDFEYEKHGVEDARITKIEDTYYMLYAAYDGVNVMGALAISNDLKHFEKKGIITPQVNYYQYKCLIELCDQSKLNPKYYEYYKLFERIGLAEDNIWMLKDKDLVLFPKKINGQFAMLHRLWPGIQIVYFDDWDDLTPAFWEDYLKNLTDYIVLDPRDEYEVNYIGAGSPPIETDEGWLLIFHGVQETAEGKVYHVRAALFHLDKPEVEISRLVDPLFSPTKEWEKEGRGNYIVFPTGTALFGKDLYIYYGVADKHIAVASLNIDDLLRELKKIAIKNQP